MFIKKRSLNYTQKSLLLSSTLLILAMLLVACQGDFKGRKSNNIAMDPRDVILVPGNIGTREVSEVIELRNTGEAALDISDIYLEVDGASGRERLDACDFERQMQDPSTILTPDVMPTCTLILRERPALPISLATSQLKQIVVTYRPLDGVETGLNPELVVESNASNGRRITATLNISSGLPDVSGNVSAIQFPSSGRSSENYLLRNYGTSPLSISAVNIVLNDPENFPAPAGGSIEFTVDSTEELRGSSIDPGGYLRLIVSYEPQDDGVDQAHMVIESNDPDQPQFEVLLTSEARPANLEIMPTPVSFTHEGGMTDTQPVTFYNTGLRPINAFLSIEPADGPFRINAADNDSFQVDLQGEQIIRLDYVAGPMPAEATLVVRSDDADNAVNGEFRIPLVTQLSASLKLLDVDVSMLSFDGVAAGDSASAMVSITSAGDAAVNLSEVVIEGSDAPLFTLTGDQSGMLAPGDTRSFEVTFSRPADEAVANAYLANLVIRSDSDGGDVQISLIANP
ncbi:MAG: hypothetical protein CMH49_10080 [Myxococcales bacterium]|nr:hypothetical protein [Myxococcales bacterium]